MTFGVVLFNSFQRLQRRSRKSNQSLGRPSSFLIGCARKKPNLVDAEILLPVKFCREVENVSPNRRPGRSSWFSDRLENINFVEDVEIFVEFRSAVRGVENVSAYPIRDQDGNLGLPISSKYINLVEVVEILFPVKFHWIPSAVVRKKSNMSKLMGDQGGHLGFLNTKHKLGSALNRCFTGRNVAWVRIPLETYILIWIFQSQPRTAQWIPCKWAWPFTSSHSCYRLQIRPIIQGPV